MSIEAPLLRNSTAASTPLVSVVVPTFGREALLLDCVESVLQQGSGDWELIIVDQDASRAVERALQARFPAEPRIVYVNEPRAGTSRARNAGIERSRGEIVAFLDDDAVAEQGWIDGLLDVFEKHPEAGIVAGRIRPELVRKIPDWFPEERRYLLGLYDIGDRAQPLPKGHLPIGANMAARRKLAVALGGFDPRFGPNYFQRRTALTGEDSMLGLRMQEAGHALYYSPSAAVRHIIRPVKLTRKHFLHRHFWEGVTTVELGAASGRAKAWPRCGIAFHTREIIMALARFVLPTFDNRYDMPASTIRMLALSRAAYSSGVLFAGTCPTVKSR